MSGGLLNCVSKVKKSWSQDNNDDDDNNNNNGQGSKSLYLTTHSWLSQYTGREIE